MKFCLLLSLLLSNPAYASLTPTAELLKKIVNIPSGSNEVAGVKQVQQIISDELKKINLQVEMIPYHDDKLGPLVVGTFKGKSAKYITFIVHSDTVFERASGFTTFQPSSDGLTANGPGVIDDKGGVVILISALKEYLSKTTLPAYSLRVVVSPGEEVGMEDFLPKFKSYSEDSNLILSLEPCLDDGSVIEGRKGNRWYNIKVVGREAHAGRDHKDGINACWELSKKLDALSQLTNYSKELSVSIGHIEGGKDKYNIVCGEASAKLDIRFFSTEVRDKFQKEFEKIMNKSFITSASDKKGTTTTFEIADESEPFDSNKESLAKIKILTKLIEKYEHRKVTSHKSGGTGDANSYARPGLAIVDGLGACGGKMHTKDEFITLSSLETRSKVLVEFLELNDHL